MADDVTVLGYVAAAMEASLLGVPAMAFSLATRRNFDFGPREPFRAAPVGPPLMRERLAGNLLLNVNVPAGVEPQGTW
jgi:5'-nucleotidase